MAPKTVLITGCSDDGIGYGLALTFQKQGYHVFVTARNVEKMTKLNGLPNVSILQLDVTEPSQIEAAVNMVTVETGGTLDILVNNAGRNHFMPFLDEDVDEVKNLFEINVWGPLRLELIPFHIKVLCITTRAVRTQGQTYFGDFKLPEDSLYKPIEEKIAALAQGNDGTPRMPLMDYSGEVVAEIEKGTTGCFWCGKNAMSTKENMSGDANEMMDGVFVKITQLDTL
ncbi:short-chain dehydrogenase [Penicillium herquei]|nr:short-chain dehydrogenase [Penicillium herquei]